MSHSHIRELSDRADTSTYGSEELAVPLFDAHGYALAKESLARGLGRPAYPRGSESYIPLPSLREEVFVTVSDEHERARLRKRVRLDDYMNKDRPLITGPACHTLYPYLVTDPYEYTSMLAQLETREMIASTTLAVLDDADSFTTIVGEDTSGRIPALIIGKAVNIMRERHGLERARRLFVSGRISRYTTPKFRARSADDRALVVSEYIDSGYSINNVLDALRRAGFVEPDVATIDRSSEVMHIEAERYYIGDCRTYTGHADSTLHAVSDCHRGVKKRKRRAHTTSIELTRAQTEQLVRTRQELGYFAREIVDIWTILHPDVTD